MNKNKENRETWLKKTIKNIPKGKNILDAGAGELQYKKFCDHLKYTSQDFGKYTGNNLSEGLQMGKWDNSKLDILSDITKIPVKKSSFDAIMCIEVIEHLPEPAKAIKEFSRILKRGGSLIITAPFCSLTHFAPYYFANGYSKYWYEKILNENGLEIIEIDYNGNYFEYLAQEFKRVESVAKQYSEIKKVHYYLLRFLKPLILLVLKYFSKNDTNSNELLCFGLHIHAKKVK